jgi:hypothetical protein
LKGFQKSTQRKYSLWQWKFEYWKVLKMTTESLSECVCILTVIESELSETSETYIWQYSDVEFYWMKKFIAQRK